MKLETVLRQPIKRSSIKRPSARPLTRSMLRLTEHCVKPTWLGGIALQKKKHQKAVPSMLLVPLCPNRYRIYQGPQTKRGTYRNHGICVCSPGVFAFSHCIELSNEGRNGTQAAQQSKLYACCDNITRLSIHLHKQNKSLLVSFAMKYDAVLTTIIGMDQSNGAQEQLRVER